MPFDYVTIPKMLRPTAILPSGIRKESTGMPMKIIPKEESKVMIFGTKNSLGNLGGGIWDNIIPIVLIGVALWFLLPALKGFRPAVGAVGKRLGEKYAK